MVYIALLRVVMPSRMIFTRNDYEKFQLSDMRLQIPRDIAESKSIDDIMFFESKYITRPLTEDEIAALKLVSNPIKENTHSFGFHFYSSVDCAVFRGTEKRYNQFILDKQTYEALTQSTVSPNFDYEDLENDIERIKSIVSKKEPLKKINKEITKSKKKIQAEVDKFNTTVRNSQKGLRNYFQNFFKVIDILNF